MSRRFAVIFFAIAALISALICWFSIDAGSVLWSILSGVFMVLSFIGYFLCSRCPHCGRVIRMDYINRSYVYCPLCGGKVDLDENILHREE